MGRFSEEHLSDDEVDGLVLGRLTGAVLERVEEHLLLCETCRKRCEALELLRAALAEGGGNGQPRR
jgi:hypothetical protein